ncbi:MAG: transporter permease [Marmoricola sp.]|nr:transporter permease [Marmoricola sp.]
MITGWRLPLRIARRDAQRARGRSILMLVMIALPVLGVTAADVLIQTQDVNSVESLDRRLGTEAAAKVIPVGDARTAPQTQSLDPEFGSTGQLDGAVSSLRIPTLRTVLATLGGSRPGLEMTLSYPSVETRKGRTGVFGTEIDLRDPLARGLFRLTSGRLPVNDREVVINRALRNRIAGDTITLRGDPDGKEPDAQVARRVVGIAESTSYRSTELVAGPAGSLLSGIGEERSWLVGGAPVTWNDVTKLNAIGALVVSRSVIEHPNAAARAAEAELNGYSDVDETGVTVAILVVVMSLIEVVLLAGPAFAVGARRQARPLALLAACGGTPRQARRVVLATGVVIGTAGSLAGVVLGLGAAGALRPVLQHYNGSWFGPFQIPWLHLVGVAAFGFLSAMIAAVVPAWIASHQDVVAVLAGRRGDRKPSSRSPYVGLVLLAVGIGLAWLGTRQTSSDGAIPIALSAILCVLGMLFLIPVVVVAVARLGRGLPLALRFAVRDAARHRSRTTPAIAAVAATVAGVVALGIGTSSDEARNRDTYQQQVAMGTGYVNANLEHSGDFGWSTYADAIRHEVPGAKVQRVFGAVNEADNVDYDITFTGTDGSPQTPDGYGGTVGTNLLVYRGTVPRLLTALPGFDAAAAKKVLDAGGVVALAGDRQAEVQRYTGRIKVAVKTFTYDEDGYDANDARPVVARATVPGITLRVPNTPPVMGIVAAPVAARLGLKTAAVALTVDGAPISKKAEKNIQEAVNALPANGYLYVERGYEASSETWIIQLVLGGLGALLMLGGTLTATFLALSDARPDLATLSAVGAAPRTRRAVAAAYALAVGGVGAVLGVLVGFVPGIAVTYPISADGMSHCYDAARCETAQHYLDVPWLLIGGLVVVLPLVVAGVVGLFARSRLPLVSRLT